MLAGVSVDYYVRLERGDLGGASDSVLDTLARALQLNEAERLHLYDLAHARTREGGSPSEAIRPSLQRLLDAIDAPALVRNRRLDYLAANAAGRALLCEMFESDQPNQGQYVFLDPRARDFHLAPDWDEVSGDMAAMLRLESGRSPGDRQLTALIEALLDASADFRSRWGSGDVRLSQGGTHKRFLHPVVGELIVAIESMDVHTRGPSLAGLAYGLDAVVGLLPPDVESAARMVRTLRAEADAALGDMRRVAHGRGPAERDLMPALRAHAERLRGGGLQARVTAPEPRGRARGPARGRGAPRRRDARAPRVAAARSHLSAAPPVRVLIVDDHPAFRAGLRAPTWSPFPSARADAILAALDDGAAVARPRPHAQHDGVAARCSSIDHDDAARDDADAPGADAPLDGMSAYRLDEPARGVTRRRVPLSVRRRAARSRRTSRIASAIKRSEPTAVQLSMAPACHES